MANALSRLLGTGDIWMVPLALPCAQCGGSMKKGKIVVKLPLWLQFFSWRIVSDDVYYIGSEDEKEVRIVGGSRTELAYRCAKCGTVLIVEPGLVGRKADPPAS
ncbi:MAG TPA: hypothetical protein VGO11_24920 [Chthoniobacteraceae bacterium]|jgi:hypothetical protein|nr:hypothetical protein [Chthoniobacteraceae bacterium]